MKETQLQKIKNQLLTYGFVSRNWCLSWYCTRLGARIIDLKKEGFKFEIEHRGGDYVYKMVKDPTEDEFIIGKYPPIGSTLRLSEATTSPKIDATSILKPKVADNAKQERLFIPRRIIK